MTDENTNASNETAAAIPTINIEEVAKQLDGIDSDTLKKTRDGERIYDSAASLVLWRRQAKGEKVFTGTDYDPEERIKYYTERGNKYVKRTVSHGVQKVLDLLGQVLPGKVIEIIKVIFKLF